MGKTMTLKRIDLILEVAQMIRIHSRKTGAGELAEMIVAKTDEAHNAVIREILKDLREFAKNEVQMRRFNKSQFEAALLYQLNICEQKYEVSKDV